MRQRQLSVTAILFSMISVQWLSAHPLDLALITLQRTVQGFHAELDLHEDMAKMAGDPLFDRTLGTLQIPNCRWSNREEPRRIDSRVLMQGNLSCESVGESLSVRFGLVDRTELPPTFQTLIKQMHGSHESIATLSRGNTSAVLSLGGTTPVNDFVYMGMRHIGASVEEWTGAKRLGFPEGIDHVLFILGLVLTGGSLLSLIQMITGFTVGHSLTLILVTLGVVELPQKWVESVIALSIAYVGLAALFQRTRDSRWKVATLFGLIHGCGFASALTELHLRGVELAKAVIGFNVGVELGQVVFVVIFYFALQALQRLIPNSYVERMASGGIAIAGLIWFVQRAF